METDREGGRRETDRGLAETEDPRAASYCCPFDACHLAASRTSARAKAEARREGSLGEEGLGAEGLGAEWCELTAILESQTILRTFTGCRRAQIWARGRGRGAGGCTRALGPPLLQDGNKAAVRLATSTAIVASASDTVPPSLAAHPLTPTLQQTFRSVRLGVPPRLTAYLLAVSLGVAVDRWVIDCCRIPGRSILLDSWACVRTVYLPAEAAPHMGGLVVCHRVGGACAWISFARGPGRRLHGVARIPAPESKYLASISLTATTPPYAAPPPSFPPSRFGLRLAFDVPQLDVSTVRAGTGPDEGDVPEPANSMASSFSPPTRPEQTFKAHYHIGTHCPLPIDTSSARSPPPPTLAVQSVHIGGWICAHGGQSSPSLTPFIIPLFLLSSSISVLLSAPLFFHPARFIYLLPHHSSTSRPSPLIQTHFSLLASHIISWLTRAPKLRVPLTTNLDARNPSRPYSEPVLLSREPVPSAPSWLCSPPSDGQPCATVGEECSGVSVIHLLALSRSSRWPISGRSPQRPTDGSLTVLLRATRASPDRGRSSNATYLYV
ncbi:hypothetical protein B0H13DRAFT_2452401 [Mycena leptocephala]|nr:hypothetical protein B0H13DRAFT_2452401 [Mycena leptocephala]